MYQQRSLFRSYVSAGYRSLCCWRLSLLTWLVLACVLPVFGQRLPDIVWARGSHAGGVATVAFSPDGSLIASGGTDGTVKVWRLSDRALVRTLIAFPDNQHRSVAQVVFSPDGSLLAAGCGTAIFVWRASDGTLLRTYSLVDSARSVAFSPDGQLIAANDLVDSANRVGCVRVWRVANGALVRTLTAEGVRHLRCVIFSPDGSTIAANDGYTWLWRVSDGALVSTIREGARSMAFSPDGRLIALASSLAVRLWRVSDETLVRSLPGSSHLTLFESVAFSPDGSLIAAGSTSHGGADTNLRIWRVADGVLVRTVRHTWGVSSVAFSPDGSLIASGADRIRLWRVSDGALVYNFGGHPYNVVDVAFSPDGRMVASAGGERDPDIYMWRVSDGTLVRVLSTPDDRPRGATCIAFSPDSSLVASGHADWRIRVWRASDGAQLQLLIGHVTAVTDVVFSPDGSLIASGGTMNDPTIRIWRLSDGVQLRTIITEYPHGIAPPMPNSMQFSPNSSSVIAACGSMVGAWRVSNGAPERFFRRDDWWTMPASVSSACLSPDGALVAAGFSHSRVYIWRASDGVQLHALGRATSAYLDMNLQVAFSPDGRILAAGSADGTIRLWRVSDGTLLQTYYEPTAITCIKFAPDGRLFAYGRADATLVVARNPFAPPSGDVNLDGCVDDTDLLAILFTFGHTGSSLREDLNSDGVVDDTDLLEVLFNIGNGC